MTIETAPDLEARLHEAASRALVSVDELADRILRAYLNRTADDERAWIASTQAGLARVWPVEDFSDWSLPAHAPATNSGLADHTRLPESSARDTK